MNNTPSSTPGGSTVNVRSVLQYIPDFRGKLFLVFIGREILSSTELVDALLDLKALQDIGVKLVVVAEGALSQELYDHAVTCEMRCSPVSIPLNGGEESLSLLKKILARGQAPFISSGCSGVFPEDAVRTAVELHASKYIALIENSLVPMRDGRPIPAILDSEVEGASGEISDRELLREAAVACLRGIPRVHLLDGMRRGVLVDELFSEEGVGTMVHADSYREIRPLREDDIPELLSMIGRSVQRTYLIERTYEDVARNLGEYYVLTLDETIVGSVAVHLYPEQESAEVACLYIKDRHEGLGYGRALVAFAENIARKAGMSHVFAISKSAVEFFRDRMHYAEWPRELLPPRRLQDLERSGRNSGVFGHSL